MAKKPSLLEGLHKDLNAPEPTKKKTGKKESIHEKDTKPPLDSNIPRGERADFLKITLTIPANLLTELRALGMRRKAKKQKDTDTSALIREALVDFLNKHKDE
jgi:hypothetical protein